MSKLSDFYAHRKEMLKGDGQFEISTGAINLHG